jgi:hypothetical protein
MARSRLLARGRLGKTTVMTGFQLCVSAYRNTITACYRESYRARPDASSRVGFVTADKVTAELVGGAHDDKAAGGRVYDKISWVRDGTD